MNAEIVAVGTELVSGQKLDTNSQWLSLRLGELGIATAFHTSLGDDLAQNVSAFRIATERAGLVVVTGGLGPTQDDLTREALAAVAGADLIEDADSLLAIRALFERRNRPMTERNRVQALLPRGAEALANPIGTAPGIWMAVGPSVVVCLPGVPNEMKRMFVDQVVPRLKSRGMATKVIVHRVVNLFGRGESEIEAKALDLTARGRVPEVGITASDATISFRVTAEGADEAEAIRNAEPTVAIIRERFGELVVGEGSADVADGLVAALLHKGQTLAVAESCTGGLVASRITAIPGVSPVFLGGVVSYANSAKVDLLGVPPGSIASHGAVSEEVAHAMAEGARSRFGADFGLAITGIAGPTGGTPEKPVGLVYVAVASASGTETRKLEIGPEQPRDVIRSRAAKAAMNLARLAVLRS